MIPRPRRYLLLALLSTSLFAILAILVSTDTAIVRLDRWIADGCYHFAIDRPLVHDFFLRVTNLGWGRLLNCIGAMTALVLVVRREWVRAVVWAAGQLAIHEIVPFAKDQFERPRPEFANIDSYSFPSGHAFGATTVYSLLGLLILRVWADSGFRWLFAGIVWGLIPLVGLSRMMLGVHYFTDVLAGISLGLGWAFWLAAIAELWDCRRITANTPAKALPIQSALSETDAPDSATGRAVQ